jgi:hypothetical protein
MRKRVRIKRAKRAGQMMADAYTLCEVMAHAKPSLATLPLGEMRRCVYDALTRPWGLQLNHRAAKRVMRLHARRLTDGGRDA